jgi:hypothetical protein
MLKSQVTLKELEPNSTNMMCSSIIDKYINHLIQYELFSLTYFNFFYNIKTKDFKTLQTQKLLGLKIIINIKLLKIGQENKFYYIHHFKIQKTRNLELM